MPVKFTVVLAAYEPRKALTAGEMYIYCDLPTMMFITQWLTFEITFIPSFFFKIHFLHVGCSRQDWLNTFICLSLAIEVGL
jgi:hypothetical protein